MCGDGGASHGSLGVVSDEVDWCVTRHLEFHLQCMMCLMDLVVHLFLRLYP